MSDSEQKLNRLFRAARMAPAPEVVEPMPGPLKTRILAHWRSESGRESGWLSVASLFRRALACAMLAMLVCLVWSYSGSIGYQSLQDSNNNDPTPDQIDDDSSGDEMPPDPMP